jgi:hypothetical protein
MSTVTEAELVVREFEAQGSPAVPHLFEPPAEGVEERIADVADVLRMQVPVALTAVGKALKQLGLTTEQIQELFPVFRTELACGLPDFLVRVALVAALPHLSERFRRRYKRNPQLNEQDAEDLSQDAIVKILSALNASRFRGNIGAWASTLRENTLRDHWRRACRQPGRKSSG